MLTLVQQRFLHANVWLRDSCFLVFRSHQHLWGLQNNGCKKHELVTRVFQFAATCHHTGGRRVELAVSTSPRALDSVEKEVLHEFGDMNADEQTKKQNFLMAVNRLSEAKRMENVRSSLLPESSPLRAWHEFAVVVVGD